MRYDRRSELTSKVRNGIHHPRWFQDRHNEMELCKEGTALFSTWPVVCLEDCLKNFGQNY